MFQDRLDPEDDVETVVVCSGGGALGWWQWTVLLIIAARFRISMICGTSAGTLNAFGFAKGAIQEVSELYTQVFTQNARQIFKGGLLQMKNGKLNINWLKAIPNALLQAKRMKGLMSNSPLTETLKELEEARKGFEIPFAFNCVDIKSGKVVRFNHDDFEDSENLIRAVVASTTIPVLLPPINDIKSKKGMHSNLVDGGLRDGTPLGQMFDLMQPGKKYRIIVIDCDTIDMLEAGELDNIGQIAGRCGAIGLNEIRLGDYEKTRLINEQLKDNPGKDGKIYAPLQIIDYRGSRSAMDFTEESFHDQYERGKRDAEVFLAGYAA